jgi:hypothetical protein
MDETYRSPRSPLVQPGDIDHLVKDLTVTLSADATLGAVQAKLAQNDQWLPIDGDPSATIGHLVNTNSTGPLRLGYGAWRDLILGVQFINGRNELITAGGVPIKNVAGYDLPKLMVGQGGVFGKLITVTTRTYRRPAGALVASFPADLDFIPRLLPTENRPHWAVMTADGLQLGYLGDQRELQYYKDSVRAIDAADVRTLTLPQDVELRAQLWRTGGLWGDFPWVFRATVPPMRIQDFAKSARLKNWVADPAFGVVLGGADDNLSVMIRGVASSMGGGVTYRTIPDGTLVGATLSPAERAIIERIKRAFDPERKLAPLPET